MSLHLVLPIRHKKPKVSKIRLRLVCNLWNKTQYKNSDSKIETDLNKTHQVRKLELKKIGVSDLEVLRNLAMRSFFELDVETRYKMENTK